MDGLGDRVSPVLMERLGRVKDETNVCSPGFVGSQVSKTRPGAPSVVLTSIGFLGGGWLRLQIPSDALHDAEIVGEVVDGIEGGGEGFAGVHEVAQIGARVAATDHAVAIGVGRALVFSVLL